MNVPSNTPVSNNIMNDFYDINMELFEPNNNCEQVSELSDDNKCENYMEARYTLPNTIIEEPKELPTDDESCEEAGEENIEQPVGTNNIMFQPINDSDKKKKKKKKKKKNATNNNSFPNITI
jgi:hypothetical protein